MRSRKIITLVATAAVCCSASGLIRAAEVQTAHKDHRVDPVTQAALRYAVAILQAPVAQVPMTVRAQDAGVATGAVAERGNLWTFLGFPSKAEMAVHKDAVSRMPLHKLLKGITEPPMKLLGLVPGPPPLEAPANLESPVKPIQAAAKIKQEENEVPARIQAIRYLAKIGCSKCYPEVEEAFLAALKDCNEDVRREAVKAIEKSECCTPKVIEQLNKMAYETDDYGQPEEKSEKVRKAAVKALEVCMCEAETVPVIEPEPTPEPEPAPEPAPEPEPLPEQAGSAQQQVLYQAPAVPRTAQRAAAARALTTSPGEGTVHYVDLENGLVILEFARGGRAALGARYMVFHRYPFKLAHIGGLEIVDSRGGGAIARPLGRNTLRRLSQGDEVVLQR